MQVLLTGKPCRNFQVLVAYSLLQMVREQVLQEGMAGDDILLVRVPFSQVQSHGSWGPRPPTASPLKAPGSWDAGLQSSLCPRAGSIMGADLS